MKPTELKFERTWCDYITPCPHFQNIMIGSYDCSRCKYFDNSKENKPKDYKVGDYSQYFKIIQGVVNCQCK